MLADALQRIDEGECVIDPTIVSRLVARKRERGPLDELTDRERDVLALIAEGHSNSAIGERLFLSRKTVEAHITQIFLKLDLRESPDRHRRVLAVLAFLRSASAGASVVALKCSVTGDGNVVSWSRRTTATAC